VLNKKDASGQTLSYKLINIYFTASGQTNPSVGAGLQQADALGK